MATLKFVDSHNMVVFLSKSAECEGFEQIVDFLNAHTIKYALTINPTIYTSCIERFWAIVKAKTINGEVQLQALVDGKKVIITESTIRRDLQLKDAKGVDCLPNAAIFEQLTLKSAKTTAWNEFSSTKDSAIICLATNQKFNFSKYIFESMVKNLDSVGKFLMYPRKQRPRKPKRKDTEIPQSSGPIDNVADEAVNEEMDDSLERAATTATSLDAEQDRGNINKTQSKATLNELRLAMEITSLKRRVKKLERRKRSRTHELKRLFKVGLTARVESSDDEISLGKDASKQGRKIHDIDADEYITLENVHDAEMFDVNDLHGEEVFAKKEVPVKEVSAVGKVNAASIATTVSTAETITTEEITLAQALAGLKSVNPKDDKVMLQEPEQARRLLVEFDEEDRIVREKDEANVALTEEWNDIQAKIEADQLLAERLQAREQEELTIE
ncbi:hypothetical protein Tco_0024793 [Tanacetum coccineum]